MSKMISVQEIKKYLLQEKKDREFEIDFFKDSKDVIRCYLNGKKMQIEKMLLYLDKK